MSTFSEIVDAVAQDTGRAGVAKLPSVIRAVNNTLRDFSGNANELQRSEFSYAHPTARFTPPTAFEKIKIKLPPNYERFEAIVTDLNQIVHEVKPGMESLISAGKNRYYIADGHVHISACFKQNINFSYFTVRRGFRYFPTPLRLIRTSQSYNHEVAYEYRMPQTPNWLPYNPTDDAMVESYARHVDWITDAYAEIVELGSASTLHNRAGNESIGARLFQQYNNQRATVIAGRT